MGYNGYTEKKKASNARYREKLMHPSLWMTPEEKKEVDARAEKAGKSFNRYVIDAALGKLDQ